MTLPADGEPKPAEPKRLALPDAPADEGKRTFLKVAVVASGLLAAGAAGSILRSAISPSALPGNVAPPTRFPRVKIANLSDLTVGTPIIFDYPLQETPNVLLKLGVPATGGIGPGGDVVAYSLICQHLGCIFAFLPKGGAPACNPSYSASGPEGYCCCHGSVFDMVDGAKVLAGPSPRPQPQVTLEVDTSGAIYAVGMGPPTIFGHNTGSNDVSYDLVGGTPVG